ncbi:MAG: hypothetical protein ACPHRE_08265 [Pseudomonadales bacterium]
MKTVFRLINPIIGWVLASRLHWLVSFQLILLEVVGRRSGKIYKIPVSYASDSEEWVCLTLASNLWWRNLEPAKVLTVHHRGRQRSADVRVESENVDRIEREMAGLIAHNPLDAPFAGVRLNWRFQPNSEDLALAAQRHVVIRLKPVGQGL